MSKFLNPFPPLNLSLDDEKELENLGNVLVDECVELYAKHLIEDHGRLDSNRWKHVKTRDDVHVYQERPQFHTPSTPADFSASRVNNTSDLPTLLAVGSMVGNLEDVMYGVANHTLDAMRIKTSYVEDNLVNAAVLATLIEPSVSEPFRCMAIKWAEKGRAVYIRTLVKNRDFVYLESTGISTLTNGEQIGFQLLHSVQFPQIGEVPDSIRGNMSMCCIYRQSTPTNVELYMRGFLDPAGGVMRAVVIKSAAEVMVSVWKNIHAAQLKKLAWAIRRRKIPRGGSPLIANRDMCTTCAKRSLLSARGTTCSTCFQPVCRSCRIRKKLSFFGPDRELIQQRIAFCHRCFTGVINTSAFTVSSDEILAKDSFRGHEYRSGTSSSSASYSTASTDGRY